MYKYQTADAALYGLLKQFAKENRQHQTEAERCLWTELKSARLNKFFFKRQHIIGSYIADFVCLEHKLIIEVDGGYHSQPEQMFLDEQRTAWLERKGFNVLRFNNEDIIGNIDNVLNIIFCKLVDLSNKSRNK